MIGRSLSAISFALVFVFVRAQVALAAGEGADPTKIGDNAKGLIEPNAKSLWWIALVIGLIVMAFTRKSSKSSGIGIILLISGIAIWNPVGVMNMMQGVADKIV